jgi:UDP-2,3-diacylglucosamine hydrolase
MKGHRLSPFRCSDDPVIHTMKDYLQIRAPEVFFLADAHFRQRRAPGEGERRARFVSFVEQIPPESALFLLGDIFDFYFEYASAVPKPYFDVFHSLEKCRSRGIETHFLGGNHDYWVGDFLSVDLGVCVHDDDFLIECQGRKIRCSHGDMVVPDDGGYHVLRALLRNPGVIRVAKLVHPDLMAAIANVVSGHGKTRPVSAQKKTAQRVAATASRDLFKWGNDVFVMGHVHYPFHRVFENRDFVIIGDWIENFSYARLSAGAISLEVFEG